MADSGPTEGVPHRPLLGGGDIRRLLDAHGLHPTKRRGQNFVTDPNTVRRIVRDAGVQPGDLVVEVGPGLGSLTLALVEAGAEVHAIEVDRGLARALADVVGPEVTITVADALDVAYADLLDGRSAVMVANLPYNVATPILMTALREGALAGYHLMVQKEVGERWVATPGSKAYGAVSVKIALLASARIAGTVSRQAFHPVPNVDSVTVDLRPLPRSTAAPRAADRPHTGRPPLAHEAVEQVIALVDAGFAQRRKMLRNALAVDGRATTDVDRMLQASDLPLDVRAEQLAPADWVRLAGLP